MTKILSVAIQAVKCCLGLGLLLLATAWASDFPALDTRAADGGRLSLPQDWPAGGQLLLAIALSDDQDNGSEQQQALVVWQQQLQAAAWPDRIPLYHVPVVVGAPRLVHGLIRRGLASSYPEQQDLARVVPLFLTQATPITQGLGIEVNRQPHLVLLDANRRVQWRYNGGYDPQVLQELLAQIQ